MKRFLLRTKMILRQFRWPLDTEDAGKCVARSFDLDNKTCLSYLFIHNAQTWLITSVTRRSGVDVKIAIFCDFCQFSAEKNRVFLINQCYDLIFAKISRSLSKRAQIFGENILKIITPVPGKNCCPKIAQNGILLNGNYLSKNFSGKLFD
jgi:hypothetical protein